MTLSFLAAALSMPASSADFARPLDRPGRVEAFLKGGPPIGTAEVRRRPSGQLVIGRAGEMTLDQWLMGILNSPFHKGIRLELAEGAVIGQAASRLDYLIKIHAVAPEALKERPVFIASDVAKARELMEWRVRFGSSIRISLGFSGRDPMKPYETSELMRLRREALYLGGAIDLRLNAAAVGKSLEPVRELLRDLQDARKLASLSVTITQGPRPDLGTFRTPIEIFLD